MRFQNFFLGLAFFASIIACEKSDINKDAQLRIYLTDPHFVAQSLSVDIQGVKVKYKGTIEDTASTSTGQSDDWVWLDTKAGIYNLLDLTSGKKALLAIGSIPGGHVKEIRLVLGPNNSLKKDGKAIPVLLPQGNEFGYKISIVRQLNMPRDSATIEFDAMYSLNQINTETYQLIPMLQIK